MHAHQLSDGPACTTQGGKSTRPPKLTPASNAASCKRRLSTASGSAASWAALAALAAALGAIGPADHSTGSNGLPAEVTVTTGVDAPGDSASAFRQLAIRWLMAASPAWRQIAPSSQVSWVACKPSADLVQAGAHCNDEWGSSFQFALQTGGMLAEAAAPFEDGQPTCLQQAQQGLGVSSADTCL
jgi:hypothetical protein